MPLLIYNLKSRNPFFNLALEEYIFAEKGKNDEDIYLLFYENSDSVILGKNLVKDKEAWTHKNLPPVLRRASGGGSVVHFSGNLNYGLVLNVKSHPEFASIAESYDIILNCVAKNLGSRLNIKPGGISDLCIEDRRGSRKISGNSQARKKGWMLHHGTILYDAQNIHKISKLLRHPPKEPDYRKGRSHKEFLITYLPRVTRSFLVKNLIQGFARELSTIPVMKTVTPELEKSAQKYLNTILANRLRC